METISPILDDRTATGDETVAAMKRGVHAALRLHKRRGVPAIVWDEEAGKTVSVPPDQIPDFPADESGTVESADQS